jgi:hypothetical protein
MKALLLHHIDDSQLVLREPLVNEYAKAISAQNIEVTFLGDGAPLSVAKAGERTAMLRYGLSQLMHVDVVILIYSAMYDRLRDVLLVAARACGMDVIPASKFYTPKFDCNDN